MSSSVDRPAWRATPLAPLRRFLDRISRWTNDHTAFRHRLPIRARIALFGAAIVALAVVTFSSLVYVLVEGSLVREQDVALSTRGDAILQRLESRGGFQTSPFSLPIDIAKSSEIFWEITLFNTSQVISSGKVNGADPVLPASLLQSAPFDHGAITTTRAEGGPLIRVYVRQLPSPNGPAGYLVVGQSLAGIENELSGLRLFLVAAGLLTLLAAGAASWWLSGRALRPLDAMANTAEDIGRTQDLSRRLPESEPDDEVGRLQRSFNQMLRQLEDAYHRLQSALVAQRRFVADASHELRTPLTTIRGNVGLLLKRDDIAADDRVAALNDIAGESERMSRMVQDLLTLARADAGYHLEKSPIDLLPIIQDVSRQAQTLQPSRRIELLDGVPAPVQGNADAIKQLLWILIDNAFKHTHDGGRVQLLLENGERAARLVVVDDGPGIPEEELERVFERFYQSDAARSGEGTGLGLAIARWIAKEHGGQVTAANNPQGGAAFTVEFPAEAKVLAKS
ncbi:MAG: two-component system, OmpR family, sensor kinase [Chloroflexota bacterium]|nr:two-component system, OmpR family, sensor kinase [Chloroflexota bacterium]